MILNKQGMYSKDSSSIWELEMLRLNSITYILNILDAVSISKKDFSVDCWFPFQIWIRFVNLIFAKCDHAWNSEMPIFAIQFQYGYLLCSSPLNLRKTASDKNNCKQSLITASHLYFRIAIVASFKRRIFVTNKVKLLFRKNFGLVQMQ